MWVSAEKLTLLNGVWQTNEETVLNMLALAKTYNKSVQEEDEDGSISVLVFPHTDGVGGGDRKTRKRRCCTYGLSRLVAGWGALHGWGALLVEGWGVAGRLTGVAEQTNEETVLNMLALAKTYNKSVQEEDEKSAEKFQIDQVPRVCVFVCVCVSARV